MSHRPIIDAGPGLNFLSINKERLLIGVLGPLSAPEAVQNEVLRKAQQDALPCGGDGLAEADSQVDPDPRR